ncbi:hypothetical protein AAHE18_12G031200 [Arachis hypogaea]
MVEERKERLHYCRCPPYELGRTIGEGSFAKVKIARNVDNGQSAAIKILVKNQIVKHPRMMEQLKKEISTMKMVQHPNVIKIYEARKGRLEENEARSYFHQLINAVDYCHSRGVYHRDLKPENLLLDKKDILKVSDFGLSTFVQREDKLLHTTCGTPNYVAPEVIHNGGYDGSASDIWSCGVILFVLMAGYLPFDEPNQIALFRKIEKAEYVFPPWFSKEAKKLLTRILDPNPLTRIKISEILQDEWFRKGYKPPIFKEEEDINTDDVTAAFDDSRENLVTETKEKPASLNAFELISRSKNFNLESMFEEKSLGMVKRETHFTSQCPPNEIMSKIEEAAKPLGFNVHKHNYKMKLQGDKSGRKGHLSVATEVFEVAPSLHVVELRKTGGDTLEFHKFYKSFSSGLQDIVWHSEENKIDEE